MKQGLTLLPWLEYSGSIMAHCSLDLLGSITSVSEALGTYEICKLPGEGPTGRQSRWPPLVICLTPNSFVSIHGEVGFTGVKIRGDHDQIKNGRWRLVIQTYIRQTTLKITREGSRGSAALAGQERSSGVQTASRGDPVTHAVGRFPVAGGGARRPPAREPCAPAESRRPRAPARRPPHSAPLRRSLQCGRSQLPEEPVGLIRTGRLSAGVSQSWREADKRGALPPPSRFWPPAWPRGTEAFPARDVSPPPRSLSQLTEDPRCDESQENPEQARGVHAGAAAPRGGMPSKTRESLELLEQQAAVGQESRALK
ncbi:hypothetical protein AAY473_021166 [Plecturocebus cupreus]